MSASVPGVLGAVGDGEFVVYGLSQRGGQSRQLELDVVTVQADRVRVRNVRWPRRRRAAPW